ncbi:hypothetical protein, partial [Xanthomonas translucens]|uniref:hypothetical protein n=1 Tax=Xanthomonas campestris pv. translucens TaxID=343 RepID=UPI001E28AF85
LSPRGPRAALARLEQTKGAVHAAPFSIELVRRALQDFARPTPQAGHDAHDAKVRCSLRA